jgi:adenylate cyclase
MKDNAFNRNLLRVVSGRLREATEERAIHYRREQLLFAEFRDHSSPEIVNRMLATGVNYGAPHFIDECVILFSDIRGFTESSSKMAANDIAEQLSLYLDSVVEIIHRHEGLVDKFIGDAVMAIWGYVPTDDDKAAQAFACAEEMVRVAATMQFGAQPISIGVGLNAGRVFIGNIGGHGKRQFTVLGSPVNLASRYEGHCKKLAVPIVMGEGFQGLLPSDLRSRVVAHHEQVITGTGPQTLYSYDPIASE